MENVLLLLHLISQSKFKFESCKNRFKVACDHLGYFMVHLGSFPSETCCAVNRIEELVHRDHRVQHVSYS